MVAWHICHAPASRKISFAHFAKAEAHEAYMDTAATAFGYDFSAWGKSLAAAEQELPLHSLQQVGQQQQQHIWE